MNELVNSWSLSRATCAALLLAFFSWDVLGGVVDSPKPSSLASTQTCEERDDARPNFLVLLTDDQERGLEEHLPEWKRLIVDQGTFFDRAYVTTSLCCPSRASILTGRYAHNHGVLSNFQRGGATAFRANGQEQDTFATLLHSSGYRTGYFGKYLNQYPDDTFSNVYVPPGWDEWLGAVEVSEGRRRPYRQFNYDMILTNGSVRHYGSADKDYFGDVVTRAALNFLERTCGPFLAFVGYVTPHVPGTPAPRHANLPVTLPPRKASFNEADMSDKPLWMRSLAKWKKRQIQAMDKSQMQRIRALAGLDESIAQIVNRLEARGQLDSTHIIFLSDNGFHRGEHRMVSGKNSAFEEDIRVPMAWRGPGVIRGRVSEALVLNIDLAPTILRLAGVSDPNGRDGLSLVQVLRGRTDTVRADFLVEHFSNVVRNITRVTANPYGLEYAAVHDGNSIYVRYNYEDGNDDEFYNLIDDPLQLQSLAATLGDGKRARLRSRLDELRHCSNSNCN